jgi:predicted nucleic acid-binding protein
LTFVLDNSVALAWCFENERTPALLTLLERVSDTGAVAPNLWPLEALNGLLVAERRGRLDTTRRRRLQMFLEMLPISIDGETTSQVWTATARLAEEWGLSAYDAAYLELADRRGLPLASLDRQLRMAASGLGVRLLTLD